VLRRHALWAVQQPGYDPASIAPVWHANRRLGAPLSLKAVKQLTMRAYKGDLQRPEVADLPRGPLQMYLARTSVTRARLQFPSHLSHTLEGMPLSMDHVAMSGSQHCSGNGAHKNPIRGLLANPRTQSQFRQGWHPGAGLPAVLLLGTKLSANLASRELRGVYIAIGRAGVDCVYHFLKFSSGDALCVRANDISCGNRPCHCP
jgi:hypothetical protein